MSLNSSGTIVPKLNLSAVMRRCGNRYDHAETYLRFSRVPRNHSVLLCRTRDGVQGELRSRALRLQAGSGAHLRLDQISVRVPLVTRSASAVAGTAGSNAHGPLSLDHVVLTSSKVHHDHLWSYLSSPQLQEVYVSPNGSLAMPCIRRG